MQIDDEGNVLSLNYDQTTRRLNVQIDASKIVDKTITVRGKNWRAYIELSEIMLSSVNASVSFEPKRNKKVHYVILPFRFGTVTLSLTRRFCRENCKILTRGTTYESA